MDEDKVFHPTVIPETPFPGEGSQTGVSGSSTGGEQAFTTEKIKETPFPVKRTAVELLSTALNTASQKILKAFEFTQSGAIQIGKFLLGQSGDVKISPDGIVARDSSGNTTFALDGDTGNAVFKGEVRSGSVVTGQVIVGNNSVIIDGESRTIIVNDGQYDRVLIGYDPGGF